MAARVDALKGRRAFLGAGAALLAAGCSKIPRTPPVPPGSSLSTHHALGHRLRDGGLAKATEQRKAKVVVVGAGISGLAAAWRMRQVGFTDFEILELEAGPGGNARWGESPATAYPWGAHYIPLPPPEAKSTRMLLADLGILQGDPLAAQPRYDERALCQAPQERLFRNGTWTEGLAPTDGISQRDAGEWRRFQDQVRAFQKLRGNDGRRAFAIPLEYSSRDPALLALDGVTMDQWLRQEGFQSEAVHWLVGYATRDDYGCDYRQVSAWAGLHYFCCRDAGVREADHDTVLTWPEGNGRIVKLLMAKYAFPVTPGVLVHRVVEGPKAVTITAWLAKEGRSVDITAEHVVWAAPFGFAARALAGSPLQPALAGHSYAPWLTANIALSEPPHAHHGAPLSWDNVLHDAASLGYVVATHQGVATRPGPTVLTWYLPLAGDAPRAGRERLLATTREQWAEMAFAELSRPHPEIRELATGFDVFANGHAMVRPVPGLIWGKARAAVTSHKGRLHFAHADASGLSLFEEAVDRGVMAADALLQIKGSEHLFRFGGPPGPPAK